MNTGLEGAGPWLFWTIVAGAFGVGFIVRSSVSAR